MFSRLQLRFRILSRSDSRHAFSIVATLLVLLVSGLTVSVLVPPRPLTENEEGEDRGETFGADAVRYRLTRLTDRFGRMPRDAYSRARAGVDLLKWSGAARRIEFAPALPVSPQMFDSAAGSSALPSPNVSPLMWRWLGPGNIGGRIRSIAIHPTKPDTMFAASAGGGIWKTTNGGAAWAPVDDFMTVLSVATLAINPANPNVMYAGTGEGYGNGDSIRGAGILRSTDGGATWSQVPGTAANWAVNRLAIAPNGQTVLAAASAGIFRSADGGTFTQVSASAGLDIDFSPSDSSKAVAAAYGAVLYSCDGGKTWQKSSGLPSSGRVETAFAVTQPDTIYAVVDVSGGVLYRSTNAGATFSAVNTSGNLTDNQGWYDTALWVSPVDGNHLLVGGIWMRESRDGGLTWQNFRASIYGDNHIIVSDPRYDGGSNRRVFVGNDGGVWRIGDLQNPDTAAALNNELGVTQFYGAAGNATSGTIVGGTQDHGTIVRTPGSGLFWTQTMGSDGGFVASDPLDPSYFYSESIYLGVTRSVDGGMSWAGISGGIPDSGRNANFIAPFILDPNNPNRMLAGGASLWRTNDVKAATPAWTAIQGASGSYVSAIAVAPGNSDLVWVGRSYGLVYKSTNATAAAPAFTALTAPVNGMVTRITIHPANWNIVYVTTGGFGPTNVLKTTDGGVTWSDATGSGTTGLPDAPVNDLDLDPANPETIYAATEVGVFVSADGGAHWDLPQDGPANVSVDELFWMGQTLVAATHGRGLFALDTSAAGSAVINIAPNALEFGSQPVGTSTASRAVTVTNTGTASITLSGAGISGPHTADFSFNTPSTCTGATLPPNASCTESLVFRPSAGGTRSVTFSIRDNAGVQQDSIPVTGGGVESAPASLPSPWSSQDIGSVGVAGATSASNGTYTVQGSGFDVWGAADAFRFVSQSLSGDGSIVARVAAVQNVNVWTKAGVMIRQSLTAGSPHASLFVTPGKGVAFQSRAAAGGASTSVAVAGTAPRWVKLVRAGSTITASTSTDGAAWTKVGSVAIGLPSIVYVGLAVTSHNNSHLASGTFESVAIAAAAGLPSGWQNVDVGRVGVRGSTTFGGGAFTVSGSGADIWNTSDAFHYAYRTLAGDGTLIARVNSIENTYRWSKAGVMVRAGTGANAAYAMMLVSAAAGSAFQYRKASGGVSASVPGGATIAAPCWIKIARSGSVLTGYQSADGVSWTQVGTVTMAMSSTVTIGLAVTSHDNTRVAKGVFVLAP